MGSGNLKKLKKNSGIYNEAEIELDNRMKKGKKSRYLGIIKFFLLFFSFLLTISSIPNFDEYGKVIVITLFGFLLKIGENEINEYMTSTKFSMIYFGMCCFQIFLFFLKICGIITIENQILKIYNYCLFSYRDYSILLGLLLFVSYVGEFSDFGYTYRKIIVVKEKS